MASPEIHVIAGPNGAGKTSFARKYLPVGLEFVNADEIAQGLARDLPRNREMQAGREALTRFSRLAQQGASFAVETTLAGSGLGPRLRRMKAQGYRIFLYYVWLRRADLAVARVAARVRDSGHHIPEVVIRERYRKGMANLFVSYFSFADVCYIYDNSDAPPPQLIAKREQGMKLLIVNHRIWAQLRRKARHVQQNR